MEVPSLCIGSFGSGDFFSLKGVVEAVAALFTKKELTFERAEEPYLHPGRSAAALLGDEKIATFGEVHPKVAAAYGIDARCYIAEICVDKLYRIEPEKIVYKALPKFPAVERDFALVCESDTPVGKLEAAIREGAGKLCESIELFDVYTGSQIESGKKSVAYRVKLRSAESTLTDETIDRAVGKIMKKLEAVGAVLRG